MFVTKVLSGHVIIEKSTDPTILRYGILYHAKLFIRSVCRTICHRQLNAFRGRSLRRPHVGEVMLHKKLCNCMRLIKYDPSFDAIAKNV